MNNNTAYFQASDTLINFIANIDGSYESFARDCGKNARTIARVRSGGRVSRSSAKAIHKAAKLAGYKGDFNIAFNDANNAP